MKRIVWTVTALAVVIVLFVWLVVVFSMNAFLFISVFGVVMFVIYRWKFGGDLGYFGRKEERWSSAPPWTPITASKVRTAPTWLVVVTIVVLVAVVGLIGYLLLREEPARRDRFRLEPTPTQTA